jgi:DUF3019 family protein
LRQCSWVRFTRSSAALLTCLFHSILAQGNVAVPADQGIVLELTPRVCTLAADDTACATKVRASWRSPRPVSVCLQIGSQPQSSRCWEEASDGSYELELTATQGVTFELRERDRGQVVASAVLRVVREMNRYRRKRREPWNVFD